MKSEIKDRKKYQAYYNKMNEIEDVKYNFNLLNQLDEEGQQKTILNSKETLAQRYKENTELKQIKGNDALSNLAPKTDRGEIFNPK